MTSIQKSGYTYPNVVVHLFLQELELLMGKNGVSAILNRAGLEAWIATPPAENLERGVDFSEYSALLAGLEDLYGPRGGRGLARRAAWATFGKLLTRFPPLSALADLPKRAMPAPDRLRLILEAMAQAFTQTSDQQCSLREEGESFVFTVHRCPACWGRQSDDAPACAAVGGMLEECSHWLFGGEPIRVEESECIALGASACSFIVPRRPPTA